MWETGGRKRAQDWLKRDRRPPTLNWHKISWISCLFFCLYVAWKTGFPRKFARFVPFRPIKKQAFNLLCILDLYFWSRFTGPLLRWVNRGKNWPSMQTRSNSGSVWDIFTNDALLCGSSLTAETVFTHSLSLMSLYVAFVPTPLTRRETRNNLVFLSDQNN